jgi:hypothetical protein
MLVSLADMKTYLVISGSTYDAFLTEQLTLVSDAVEGFCRRKFITANYIQTYYLEDFESKPNVLDTFHFPLSVVTYVKEDGITVDSADYRIHKPTGLITKPSYFFSCASVVEISYTAGEAAAPTPVQYVVKSIVEERYNKKVSGVSLNFGSDVQRVSIPGTISIDFDYTLTSNDRKNSFGNILGNYINNLDPYRSERAVNGAARIAYVS